jgi:hypothetical protein
LKIGMPCLALGIGLLTAASFAQGQTSNATFIAQALAPGPPSGVLRTEPPAPVPVPPSGVVMPSPTVEHHPISERHAITGGHAITERHAITTPPVKAVQTRQIAKRATPHIVHKRLATQRKAIVRTSETIPPVMSTSSEQPSQDAVGYELLLSQLGKGKVSQ